MAGERDEFRELLQRLKKQAKELQSEYLRLKEDTSEAKKRYEAKVVEIQEAIDEDYPLFDGRRDDGPAPAAPAGPGPDGPDDGSGGGDDGPGPIAPVSPPPSGDGDVIDVEFHPAQPALPSPGPTFIQPVPASLRDESWREVSLDALSDHGLSDKMIERMAEAGLKTMGDLANHSNAGKRLTDIDGVGEARADEIESATDSFWAAWRARPAGKSGGDLVTSRPGVWANDEIAGGEEHPKPKRSRKKKSAWAIAPRPRREAEGFERTPMPKPVRALGPSRLAGVHHPRGEKP